MNLQELKASTDMSIKTPHHFSVGVVWKKPRLSGYTIRIEAGAGGDMDKKTGMILDFSILKKLVRWIDEDFDHKMLVPSGHPIIHELRDRAINIVELPSTKIRDITRILFDRIRNWLKGDEGEFLRFLRLRASASLSFEDRVASKDQPLNRDFLKLPASENAISWRDKCNFTVNFVHRLEWHTELCRDPHWHTWNIALQFQDPISEQKYKQVCEKLWAYLKETWNNLAALRKKDDLGKLFEKHQMKVKYLLATPTTENIACEMFIHLQNILDKDWSSIKIRSLELEETPSNKFEIVIK